MEWTPGGSTSDIEDRRSQGGGGFGFGGGGFGGGRLGCGGILVIGLLSLLFRQNLFTLFEGGAPQSQTQTRSAPRNPGQDAHEEKETQFVTFVLNDVQQTWDRLLPLQEHRPYRHATLVLFRNVTHSPCGAAREEIGPFYCPADEKVYLDMSFFDELKSRFGAPGEFAQAYVIAHEIGHHVQKVLGIESQVRRLQQARPDASNPLSVRLELQADCFAGVWGHTAAQRGIINQNDVQSGLGAAAAVGDDRLQKMATGRVSPESFTHGSSAQRTSWFVRGLKTGDLSSCDTFQTR